MTTSTDSGDIGPKSVPLRKRAFYAFATANIFQRRARKYRKLVQWLTFLAIGVPLAVGGIVLANVLKSDQLGKVLPIAGILGAIQIVISGWALVANWAENLEYSSVSASDNFRLSSKLNALADQVAQPPQDFDLQSKELVTLDDVRRDLDIRRDISTFENRYGHRAALIRFNRACDGCTEKPPSIRMRRLPWGICGVCGGKRRIDGKQGSKEEQKG